MANPLPNNDYLWGAAATAEALGVNVRQAYYLLENGLVPGFHIGSRWVVKRAELEEFLRSDKRAANKAEKPAE